MSLELQPDRDKWLVGIEQTEKEKYSSSFSEKLIQYCLHDKYKEKVRFFTRNKYIFDGDWRGTWESDVFMQKNNGYTEIREIKVASSDVAKEKKFKGKKHAFINKVWESGGDYLRNPKYNPDKKNSQEFLYSCPNKFVFLCPAGLMDPEYVREEYPYAGLEWIMNNGKIKTLVRAKVHGIKQNLDDKLLIKFYNNSSMLDYAAYILARDFKRLDKPTAAQLKKIVTQFVKDSKLRYV